MFSHLLYCKTDIQHHALVPERTLEPILLTETVKRGKYCLHMNIHIYIHLHVKESAIVIGIGDKQALRILLFAQDKYSLLLGVGSSRKVM